MKSIDLFVAQVLPFVMGCTEPMAKTAVLESAIEFCQRTNAVRRLETMDAELDVDEYDVPVPGQMVTNKVIEVYYGTTQLYPNDATTIDDVLSTRGAVNDSDPSSGDPTAFYAVEGDATFKVYPIPDATTTNMFTVKASFVPLRTATQLDDVLYNRYLQYIRSGAVAYLASLPAQPFTSLPLYQMHKANFELGVSRAIAESRKGAAITSSRVRARAFA